jgi:ABC-type antimicrobial peptide transport system permease subunit
MTQGDKDQPPSFNAVVRVEGLSAGLGAAARSIVQKINPEIPAPKVSSMETMVDESLSAERTMALLSGFFAVCALMVTGIGLYGTLAYATARRTTEIGIRMALGAKRVQVARMIFAQNSAVAITGTAAGLACALLGSKVLASFLYGTSARDPWVFGAAIILLALIASAASLLPALRAARTEPMQAMRRE